MSEGAVPKGVPPAGTGLDGWLDRVASLRAAESVLRELFLERGYREVSLPVVERLGSGAAGEGGTPVDGRGGYLFLDGEGTVWALRSDVTPALARLVWEGDRTGVRPRRLFYFTEVYRRIPGETAPTRCHQVGAEVIGGGGGDVEILRLAGEVLEALGVTGFRLVVGHVGVLRDTLAGAGLDAAGVEAVLDALQRGDYVGVGEVTRSLLPAGEAARLAELLTWRHGEEGAGGSPRRQGVPAPWDDPVRLLGPGAPAGRLVLDPGLVRDRGYYTGMVFEILAAGAGRPLGGGGRYDGTLSPEPAVGFALDLEAALAAARTAWWGAAAPAAPPAALYGRLQVSAIH